MCNSIKYYLSFIAVIICHNFSGYGDVYGQSNWSLDTTSNSIESSLRIGDIIEQTYNFTSYKTARFLPIIAMNPYEDWTSSSTQLEIEGIPFELVPFNLNTVDLLPIDLQQIESISSDGYNSIGVLRLSNSQLNIRKSKISDSFEVQIRGFLGSETGDPLVHVFTRPEISSVNKNKIVPSGVLSISNTISDLSYRFTLGYFGFYSTGSNFDTIMSEISNYYFKKQNKQIVGSAEINYRLTNNRSISVYASLTSYYGWEITPYLTTYSHIENYLGTVRVQIKNLIDGLNLAVKGDNTIGEIHEGVSTPNTKFRMSQFSFIPSWNKKYSEYFKMNLSFILDYYLVKNIQTENTSYQRFFYHDSNKFNYLFKIDLSSKISKHMNANIKGQYEMNFSNQSEFSGFINLRYRFNPQNSFVLNISSIANFPNLTESYGIYTGLENSLISSNADDLISQLRNERINSVELILNNYFPFLKSIFNMTVFHQRINDLIYRKKTFYYVHPTTHEPITRGRATNGDFRKLSGFKFSLASTPNKTLNLQANYQFIDNAEVPYTPKHIAKLIGKVFFDFNGILNIAWNYRDKANWDEYELDASSSTNVPEYLKIVPESNTIDIGYLQTFTNSYFTKKTSFGLSVRNIFNQASQTLPNGKSLGRTLIFSINLVM